LVLGLIGGGLAVLAGFFSFCVIETRVARADVPALAFPDRPFPPRATWPACCPAWGRGGLLLS